MARNRTTHENKRYACQYTEEGKSDPGYVRFATKKGAQNYADKINGGHFRNWKVSNGTVVDLKTVQEETAAKNDAQMVQAILDEVRPEFSKAVVYNARKAVQS